MGTGAYGAPAAEPVAVADELLTADELFMAGFNLSRHNDDISTLLAMSAAGEPDAAAYPPVHTGGVLDSSYEELYALAPALSEVPAPVAVVEQDDPREAELGELRNRIAYYDAFDALIRDNIQRSGELFRVLYEERQSIRRDVEQARAEIEAAATLAAEQHVATERQKFQHMLMTLMDEASRTQRQVDGLIQRIAETITETSR